MEDLQANLLNGSDAFDLEAAQIDDGDYDSVTNDIAWSRFKTNKGKTKSSPNHKPLPLKLDFEFNTELYSLVIASRGNSFIDQTPQVRSLALCVASYENNIEWMRAILEGNQEMDTYNVHDVMIGSIVNNVYATPIEHAAQQGHLSALSYLFEHAASLDTESVRRALLFACTNGCWINHSMKENKNDENQQNHTETRSIAIIDKILEGSKPHGFIASEILLQCEAACIAGSEGWGSGINSNMIPKTFRNILKRLRQFGDDCIDEAAWGQGLREAALYGSTQLIATQLRVHPNILKMNIPQHHHQHHHLIGIQTNSHLASQVWTEVLTIARDNGDITMVDLLRRSGRLSLYETELSARWAPGAWSLWAGASDMKRLEMSERLALLTDYPHSLSEAIKCWFKSFMNTSYNCCQTDVFNTSSRIQELKTLLGIDGGEYMNVDHNERRSGSLISENIRRYEELGGGGGGESNRRSSGRASGGGGGGGYRLRGCHVDADLRPFYGDTHRRVVSKPPTGVAITALERAAEVGDDVVVRLLLRAGARTTGTACFVAKYWNHRKVCALLSGPRAKALKSLYPQVSNSTSTGHSFSSSPSRTVRTSSSTTQSSHVSSEGIRLPTTSTTKSSNLRHSNLSIIEQNYSDLNHESKNPSFSSENTPQVIGPPPPPSHQVRKASTSSSIGVIDLINNVIVDSPEIEALRFKEYKKRVGTHSFFYWRYISRMDWYAIIFIFGLLCFLCGIGIIGLILTPHLFGKFSIF